MSFEEDLSENLSKNEENNIELEEIKIKNELKVNKFAFPDEDTDKDKDKSNDTSFYS
jgi:hypothetical protein